jgi:hypothetical protein
MKLSQKLMALRIGQAPEREAVHVQKSIKFLVEKQQIQLQK